MFRSNPRRVAALSAVLACSSMVPNARALDKQGSAHGGDVGGADTGFGVSGSAGIGVSVYNPSYAARPDNTGHALMRYLAHADVDLVGQRLSIPIDLNVFSDRDRKGALMFGPTELDTIGGLTSTWQLGKGALWNPTYAARPDNSGNALFRYALHGEVSFLDSHAGIALDGTTFTDRQTKAVRPSELDLTPELVGRWDPFELHLAYERDMPLDELGATPGYVQSFVYALAVWSFDFRPPPPT